MKSTELLEQVIFHDAEPFAQPLLVDQHCRIIRWTLRPGQQISEHKVPELPFYAIVLQGHGLFAGSDRQEQAVGPGSLLILEPSEPHSVRATDEELIFVSFMPAVESMRPDRIGGEIGRE